jgi:histidinol-phosphate aminotransferase
LFRNCLKQLDPYKAGKPISELKKELGLDQVYKLNANENPMGPSSEAMKAIGAIIDQISTYPDAGSDRLRLALSGFWVLSRHKSCSEMAETRLSDL